MKWLMPGRKNKKDKTDGRMSTEELAERQRQMWASAEDVIAAHQKARGTEVGPARERMLHVADEVDAAVGELERAGASERQVLMAKLAADEVDAEVREIEAAGVPVRQVLMAKLAAEEIRGFVNEALARHPEGQQP